VPENELYLWCFGKETMKLKYFRIAYLAYFICLLILIVEEYKKVILFTLFSSGQKAIMEVTFLSVGEVWTSDFFLLVLIGLIPLLSYVQLTSLWEFSSNIFWFEKKWGIIKASNTIFMLVVTLLTITKKYGQILSYFGSFVSNETVYFNPQLNSLLSQLINMWLLLIFVIVWKKDLATILSFFHLPIIVAQCIFYLVSSNFKARHSRLLRNC